MLFFLTGLWVPHSAGAAENAVSPRTIITIEEERLYLLPLGEKNGAKINDAAFIFRGEEQLAEVKLISVLPDSSLGEITAFLKPGQQIEPTDTVSLKGGQKVKKSSSPKKEQQQSKSNKKVKAPEPTPEAQAVEPPVTKPSQETTAPKEESVEKEAKPADSDSVAEPAPQEKK